MFLYGTEMITPLIFSAAVIPAQKVSKSSGRQLSGTIRLSSPFSSKISLKIPGLFAWPTGWASITKISALPAAAHRLIPLPFESS
jgi:hypothetical protein